MQKNPIKPISKIEERNQGFDSICFCIQVESSQRSSQVRKIQSSQVKNRFKSSKSAESSQVSKSSRVKTLVNSLIAFRFCRCSRWTGFSTTEMLNKYNFLAASSCFEFCMCYKIKL